MSSMNSISIVMNIRASAIVQSARLIRSSVSPCATRRRKSIFMHAFTFSGVSPLHADISPISAYAFRRCSGLISRLSIHTTVT